MHKPQERKNRIVEDVERIAALEMKMTVFNNERSLSHLETKLTATKMGGATLLMDRQSPQSSYYNRVIGFGPAEAERLPDILRHYGTANIVPCFDMTPDKQSGAVAEALSSQGFVPRLQLVFLKRELEPETGPGPRNQGEAGVPALSVRRVATPEEAKRFIALIGRSNGGAAKLDEQGIERKCRYFCRDDFQNFVAYADEDPAAMGSLFIRGEEGYVANDFTFPDYRGQGLQTALIRHRLQAAAALELKRVYVDVEFGTASHRNMLKAGFEQVYMNTFWMKSAIEE
ncbi:GNAT family N-acetyltransferase [Paenibacillus macerans]|uniref:Acetyltransferase family protein n=1 Tax=Paenibacillus macerans TaxID=44252 RepID=A0A090YRI1_PAEMA|nr:GNAT family N-acetyltransferase [Paenibacillus macerans]KFN00867.1 acetyltransferase family protein [Paenibacillus macerans]MCY7561916.1 GNAT family N-acetyltransferase [Paenibacillus macerans]MDU5946762.1 GNAT family N-acetyltransferase [Paenibacillus macerans]MEC0135582.1 GNAT family N-acetyltransferase [Paenibacillus macerans]MEC0153652.1 GNAT family N-acetyltransferase [Paenibacillus macerans]